MRTTVGGSFCAAATPVPRSGASVAKRMAPLTTRASCVRMTIATLIHCPPAVGGSEIDDEGYAEDHRPLHRLLGQRLELVELLIGRLEQKLIVHLKEHASLHATVGHEVAKSNHGDLDDVAGGPLHRRVNGHPLAGRANRVDV